MSKSAWLFLCLFIATAGFGLGTGHTTAQIASGVFACLLLLTLIVEPTHQVRPDFALARSPPYLMSPQPSKSANCH